MTTRRNTNQDISWFLDLNSRGLLDLNPRYQRRSVWTRGDRLYFLDTIFRGYPSPAIFLHKTVDEAGTHTYHVVDGKQRLKTIFDFADNQYALSPDFGDARFNGRRWVGLDEGSRRQFWDYSIPVEMLSSVENAFITEVFSRLNRNSRKLERQELRHARFDGWIATFCEAEASKDEWRHLGVVTSVRAKRMKDVQFISELVLLTLDHRIHGFDQDELDDFYAEYDAPDESKPEFNEEAFIREFEEVKGNLLGIEQANQAVTSHANSYMNFYSLWSFVTLRRDIFQARGRDFPARYDDFMRRVREVADADDPAPFVAAPVQARYRNVLNYVNNMRGANTDLAQRDSRNAAMVVEFSQ
jgi:hypothetical protein